MISERQAAENEIARALNPLEPDEAMATLIEIQALILAEHGIVPCTPEFEQFVTVYLAAVRARFQHAPAHDRRCSLMTQARDFAARQLAGIDTKRHDITTVVVVRRTAGRRERVAMFVPPQLPADERAE